MAFRNLVKSIPTFVGMKMKTSEKIKACRDDKPYIFFG